jgi:threonine aldolase|tara:strand:+ start:1874 stop:2125 length:252 start_codon:yes stop_codon:yes gene_type:complete
MHGNTMLNITNMTRKELAGKQNGQQDQSYVTKRHQGPPSQSRFINLQELTSLQDTSYLQQDAEVSGMLKDNFNKSINVTIDYK